ncbi:Phage terminase large subunit (GpA) [Clostridium formicaceticum]|uniref:Phage terminase large subunit (GpA) n=1 Tax=Clostridium formicaceticum TaxID=1497 RepID=A0AAC9RKJ2_9CLOT|nr:Phage terminase large subunit (GpA) [Clostridium formicaceticum]
MLTSFGSKILAMASKPAPALIARDDIGIIQELIKKECFEVLDELSSYDPAAFYGEDYIDVCDDMDIEVQGNRGDKKEFKDSKIKGTEALKTFINTYLGENWEDLEGEVNDEEALIKRRERYGCPVPESVLMLTAGITGVEQGYGLLQTINGHGVRTANEGECIIGVTSATAGVILGDTLFSWQGRWLKDEWGAYIYETVIDEDTGEKIEVPKENPDWNPEIEQQSRLERPDEWTIVGLVV